MTDEWFEEYCHVCRKDKYVHNDYKTSIDNPGFICKKCESARDAYKNNLYLNPPEEPWDDLEDRD